MSGVVRIRPPARPPAGRVALPGSKSITNRMLLLAALARGESRIAGALKSDDTRRMAHALAAMGVRIDEPDDTRFVVRGDGRLRPPSTTLQLGNAGTAMRFLTAAAALVDGEVTLDGDAAMRRRPIGALVEALDTLGVEIAAPGGCPPVAVRGRGGLDGGAVEIDAGLSSQYVSALLMIAPCARAPVEVRLKGREIGARGYVDLTLGAMVQFGARARPTPDGAGWRIEPTGYRAAEVEVEPDASAATYFWAAQALTGGDIDIGLEPDRFTQPDARAHPLIARFPHMPGVIDGSQIQDAVPTLAVLAAFNAQPVRFTGIANLRVKECDRIAALACELSRLAPGLAREAGDDLVVMGRDALPTAVAPGSAPFATYDDHRMAMSLALLGLRLEGVAIADPGCVAKTYPGYWRALAALGVELAFDP